MAISSIVRSLVMPIDRTEAEERLARIDKMLDEYHAAKQRQLMRRAVKLWREAEAQARPMVPIPPERVH